MCWSRGPLPVVRSDCGSVPEFKGLRESGAPASLMFRKPPWAVRVADSDLDASPSSRPAPRWPRPGHGERDARRCWRAPAQECTARSAGLGRSSGGGEGALGVSMAEGDSEVKEQGLNGGGRGKEAGYQWPRAR